MSAFTRRDFAVLAFFSVLTGIAVLFAFLDWGAWALATAAILLGSIAVLLQVQFAVRRDTYGALRRTVRDVKASGRRTASLTTKALRGTEAARTDIADTRSRILANLKQSQDASAKLIEAASERLQAAAQVTQEGSSELLRRVEAEATLAAASRANLTEAAKATKAAVEAVKATQEHVASMSMEMAALRSELRGVRISQQLFSRTMAQAQTQTALGTRAVSATESDRLASRAENRTTNLNPRPESASRGSVNDESDASAVAGEVARRLESTIRAVEWQVRRQRADLISDFQAMEQLLTRFDTDAPLPPLAGWALSPAGLLMLTEVILKRGYEFVVECGSGSSTLWMAMAMRKAGRGKVIALEHLPEYARRTREMLHAHGVSEWAEVVDAPLIAVHTPQGEFPWYDTSEVAWDAPVDLLLVDGPPTTTGVHARYPALSVLGNRLRAGSLIVVDDTDRADEQEVIEVWEREHPQLVRRTSPSPGIEIFSFGEAAADGDLGVN